MTHTVADLRRRTQRHRRRSWHERYLQLFAAAMLAVLAVRPAGDLLHEVIAGRTGAPSPSGPALIILALLAVLALARAFGPLVLSPGDTRWLLPTPLDRRAVLLPAATRLLVTAVIVGAGLGVAALAIAVTPGEMAVSLVTAVVIGVSVTVAGVAGTVLAQPSDTAGTWIDTTIAAAAAVAALVAIAAAAGVLPPWPRAGLGALLPVAGVTLVAAAGAVRAVWGRLRTFPTRTVQDASTRVGNAANLTIGLEPALVAWVIEDAHFRRRRLRSAPWPRLPAPARIAWADWRTLARRPKRLLLLALTTLIPALLAGAGAGTGASAAGLGASAAGLGAPYTDTGAPAAGVGGLFAEAGAAAGPLFAGPPVLSVAALFAGALAAAATGTSGVRRDGPAGGSGALARAFGPSPATVRAYRAVLPVLLAAGWLTIACAMLSLTGALTDPSWAAAGIVTAPALGAAALRMARRGPVDHSLPHLDTPAGPIPVGPVIWLMTGLDLALLGSAPALLAVLAGAPVTWPLIATQAALSCLVLAGYLMAARRR